MLRKVALALTTFTLPLASFAAAPSVTDTVTEIGTYAAPVAAIGLAVLAVVLAVKGVKWFRRAL
jgi:hypothetical protein